MNDCEGEHKVWTREGKTFTAHAVQIGITNGIYTEIINGINEGDTIINEATIGVLPGESIQPEVSQGEDSERSPFMPGPPDRNNNKKKNEKSN